MGLLDKVIKRQATEDLDFEEQLDDSPEAPDQGGGTGRGLMGKVMKWRPKAGNDDTDLEEDDDDYAGQPNGLASESAGPGIGSDAVSAGASSAASKLAQDQGSAAPGPGGSSPGDGPENQAVQGPSQVQGGPADEEKPGEKSESSGAGADGLDLSLKEILKEEEDVDEALKDLASSIEEVAAVDLAGELHEFLEALKVRPR